MPLDTYPLSRERFITIYTLYSAPGDSRKSYYSKALTDNAITKIEYDALKEYYGNLWNYTGD